MLTKRGKGRPSGFHHTKKQKQKISKAVKKAMKRPEVKEKIIAFHNKYRKINKCISCNTIISKNARRWCRKCFCQIIRGKNHQNWKGGISFEPYPLGWNKTHKEQIRYRDKYKCQICGVPEIEGLKKLCVHHIDYHKKNINPENLISLCNSCHSKTNGNRKYWKKIIKELIVS